MLELSCCACIWINTVPGLWFLPLYSTHGWFCWLFWNLWIVSFWDFDFVLLGAEIAPKNLIFMAIHVFSPWLVNDIADKIVKLVIYMLLLILSVLSHRKILVVRWSLISISKLLFLGYFFRIDSWLLHFQARRKTICFYVWCVIIVSWLYFRVSLLRLLIVGFCLVMRKREVYLLFIW